jgi:hypothetical protein
MLIDSRMRHKEEEKEGDDLCLSLSLSTYIRRIIYDYGCAGTQIPLTNMKTVFLGGNDMRLKSNSQAKQNQKVTKLSLMDRLLQILPINSSSSSSSSS